MDILDYRHRLIEQLLADYRHLEKLSDPAEQLPVQQRITRLLSELKAIEQSMKRTGQQFTAYHRVMDEHNPDSSSQRYKFLWQRYTRNQPLEQLFSTDQLSELIAKVGYAEANEARYRLRGRGETLLGNMDRWMTQLRPLAESQTLLSWRNPFSQWLPELFLFRMEQRLKANHGRQPLVDYTMEQMSWAADYASGQPPHVSQDCLALFEHDSVVDAWVAKEQERLVPEDSPGAESWPQQRLRRLIDHRFYQPAGKALWEYVKQHALEFDEYPQRYQSLDAEAELNRQLAVNSLTANLARAGVDPRPDTSGNVNQLAQPPKTVRPQFQNENGEPYRNTQILCWRYHPEKEKELGNMALDGALFGLFTVALMYTDDNGYPTLQKPDFLQKGEHDQCLQVDPATGNVLLLERTQARQPQQPVVKDPMVATWYSYDETDHLAFMQQAVGLVSDRSVTQETWKTQALADLGLDAESFFNHDCGEVDLASFFELTEGYYYGFMMLPLGYGSMAIKSVHSLPFQSNQTSVCTRAWISGHTTALRIPRNLRQYTHELTQCREAIKHSYDRLLEVSVKKREDIFQIGELQRWVQHTIDSPFNPSDHNMQEKQKLADLLQDLQIEIDRCIYQPAYVPSLAHGDTDEQRLFSYQLQCKQAADAYQQAWDQALDYLNNQRLHDQIHQWHEAQNDVDEQEQLATVQWVDEASAFFEKNPDRRSYHHTIPQCTWQPPKDLIETLCEPYTGLIYEAFGSLLTQMSVCYRSPELNADGEKINPEETDLLDDVLLPALSFAVNQEWLTTLVQEIWNENRDRENSDFLVAASTAAISTEFDSPSENLLAKTAGLGYQTFKSTFLRGPGTPALAEAIIDLAGQLVKVRYSLNVKVQTQLSIRLYSLHMFTMLRISSQTLVQTSRRAELNRMGRFIYRTLAGSNPVQFRRLMSAEQLSERVYGGNTWGDPSSRLVRFEGYLKTAAFFIDSVIGIVTFMQQMNEKDWDDPSPEAFRSAAYKLATSAETQLARASGLLTVPSMLRFWSQKLGATEGAMARFLSREIGVGVQMASGIAFGRQGYRLSRWLTGATAGKLATTAGLAAVWANRLCVASSCIALIKNIADVSHSAALGDEGDIMLNVTRMVANGATVLGFAAPLIGLNAIPGLGNALFIGGVVLSLAIEAWQFYWKHWGRAQWYSNTYVVFDDQWEGFTDSTHAQEYRQESLGASPKLAGLIKQIEDQRSNTAVDVFRYVSIAYVNSQTASARAAASILNLPHPKKIEQDSGDVAWNELSWCGLPALMMHQLPVTPEQMDKKLIYIDLNKEECLWLYCYDRNIPQVDWKDYTNNRTTLPADLDWDDLKDNTLKPALKRLLLACYNRANTAPDSPFARLIWQPLVNGGKFPRTYMRLQLAEATENAPFELLEIQMDAGRETGRYVANSHFHKMLKLWESRSALIPKTSSRYPKPQSPDADESQQENTP